MKTFYNKKNHINFYTSKVNEMKKNLIQLEKSLKFKKNCIYSDEYKTIKSFRKLFK